MSENSGFTWTDDCDTVLFTHGHAIAVTDAPKEIIIEIVETVSNQIGRKLDWHYAGGRGIIKALDTDMVDAVRMLIEYYPNGKIGQDHNIMIYDVE
jgi:hypothetical protein